MFLENSSIDMNQHKIKTISLLWDMNKLFEEFIFEFIRRNKDKINEEIGNKKIEGIKYQKGKRLLYCEQEKQYYGNTFVDIFLETSNDKIIVDTKYKINEGKFGEFANSDIFQMITYETIHNSQNAILIYPTVEINKENIHKYKLCEDKTSKEHYISTATMYLGYNLQESKEILIKRLSKILNQAIN